jgi:hypothetical protein
MRLSQSTLHACELLEYYSFTGDLHKPQCGHPWASTLKLYFWNPDKTIQILYTNTYKYIYIDMHTHTHTHIHTHIIAFAYYRVWGCMFCTAWSVSVPWGMLLSKVHEVISIKCKVVKTFRALPLLQWSISIFNIIPKSNDSFTLSWHCKFSWAA